MPEDEDLKVFVGVTPPHTDNQFKEPAQAEVDKGEEHDRRSWHPGPDRGQPARAPNGLVSVPIGILVPFRPFPTLLLLISHFVVHTKSRPTSLVSVPRVFI
jgi:hypothetical protein